jgi:pimeloyl-ACP methyl ester carboxylesterase
LPAHKIESNHQQYRSCLHALQILPFGSITFMRLRVLVVLTMIWASFAGAAGTLAQTPVASLEWEPCPAEISGGTVVPGLDCTFLQVPLDYENPTGDQITIGLNRLPARDPQKRIGALFFNPGGPGGAASSLIAAEAAGYPVFDPDVRDHFDLVGMDPRGVGLSTPIRCDAALWNARPSLFPQDASGFAALQASTEAIWQSCLELTGPLLEHLDTVSAARDMEQVRLALGGEPLNYFGLSYGTQLGATYAQLHPENIRVMALDGALDHGQRGLAMLTDEATAHEDALVRFAAWCATETTCALHGEDVLARYDALVTEANASPIPAPQCEATGACSAEVTGDDIRLGTQNLLLIKDAPPELGLPGWEAFADAMLAAEQGDASAFARELAQDDASHLFASTAIACADWRTDIATWDDLQAYEIFGKSTAPHTQGATQTWTVLTGCMGWPFPVANPPGVWDITGAPPILIVNATHDPSTNYLWAQLMREQIDGSVLLTREGDGHTSFFLTGDSATRDAITHYLLTGETPPPNTVVQD